jgi:hypothetical protein
LHYLIFHFNSLSLSFPFSHQKSIDFMLWFHLQLIHFVQIFKQPILPISLSFGVISMFPSIHQ